MEPVIIAAGSNLGNRLETLQKAGLFLENLSEDQTKKSSVWESEPVGQAKFTFLNSAARIVTHLSPQELLRKLKKFEQQCGREKKPKRWGPRVLDLDIICYGSLVVELESLMIPHPEYSKRLFVLKPMQEVEPGWEDPQTGTGINRMIEGAPEIEIKKTDFTW